MPDMNRTYEFEQARIAAQGRRQAAHAEALAQHKITCADINAEYDAAVVAATEAHNAAKTAYRDDDPATHEALRKAGEEERRLRSTPPDYREADAAMDAAYEAANRACIAEIRAAAREHGVTTDIGR